MFVPLHIFCSLAHFLFPCTLFVPFGTFFTHVSTPTTTRITTTTKLLLGPLSVARGQKTEKIDILNCSKRFCSELSSHVFEKFSEGPWEIKGSLLHQLFRIRNCTAMQLVLQFLATCTIQNIGKIQQETF